MKSGTNLLIKNIYLGFRTTNLWIKEMSHRKRGRNSFCMASLAGEYLISADHSPHTYYVNAINRYFYVRLNEVLMLDLEHIDEMKDYFKDGHTYEGCHIQS